MVLTFSSCTNHLSALSLLDIYRPQTKFAKVMFLYLSVILLGGGQSQTSLTTSCTELSLESKIREIGEKLIVSTKYMTSWRHLI